MRLLNALKSDVKFQMRQGFYVIYIIITIFYMIALSWLPDHILKYAVAGVLYSDPSVLGLFFIGGIIMLEKVQGIIDYVIVTPLRIREYIFSKVISLAFLSVVAGCAISIVTYSHKVNWLVLIIGILLTSVLYTLLGILICTKCKSVNEFMVKMIPYMLIFTIPCLSLIGFKYSYVFTIFPSVATIRIVFGAYTGISTIEAIILIIYTLLIDILIFNKVQKVFEDKIVYGG